MADINLLPSRAKFQAKKMAIKSKLSSFLWIFGGFWVLLLLVVLGGFFVSNLVLSQENKKYDTGLAQYKNLLGSMVVNQEVKYRAKIVSQMLDDRFEYGSSIEKIKSMFSENVSVDDINIDGKKQFVVEGTINNGNYVSEVEEKIVEINNGDVDDFSEAVLQDIQINNNGSWKFKMEVSLK